MMLEIKLRIRAVDKCINENKSIIPALEVEYCFLQFRKIIEQISFASIICDHQRYKDFRFLEGQTSDKDNGDYSKDWNASIILRALNDINPLFMPRPIRSIESSNNEHHLDMSDVNATHKKLIDMYKKCSSYMHIPKPFSQDYVSHIEKQRKKYASSNNTIESYVSYFKALLWHHVTIGLEYIPNGDKFKAVETANPKNAWVVNFKDPNSNDIEVVIGVAE